MTDFLIIMTTLRYIGVIKRLCIPSVSVSSDLKALYKSVIIIIIIFTILLVDRPWD